MTGQDAWCLLRYKLIGISYTIIRIRCILKGPNPIGIQCISYLLYYTHEKGHIHRKGIITYLPASVEDRGLEREREME